MRRITLTHLSIALLITGFSTSLAAAEDSPQVKRAREIWGLLASEHFDEFVATGDETMRSAFTAAQAQQLWAGLCFQLGKYESVESAKATRVDQYDSVRFAFRFERGVAVMRLVLNKQGQLSGLWTDAVTPNPPYEPPAYVDQAKFREEPITVTCGRYELPGALDLPKDTASCPAVVLVHGSGPHDEDETVGANKPFRDLAWGLASRGVAVLRYEKRTQKYKDIKPDDLNLDWETIDDALAAVSLVRQQKEIDAGRVFVLGHSLGGMAAPFIATRDDKIAGIILMAANARPPLALVEDQIEYLAKADGDVSAEEQVQIDTIKATIAKIRGDKPYPSDELLLGAPALYWARLEKLDQVAAASKLHCPILILQGGRDYQVTDKDFAIWQKRLGGRENVTFRQYPALNHLMMAGQGPSTPQEYQQAGHIDQAVIEEIAKWIGK